MRHLLLFFCSLSLLHAHAQDPSGTGFPERKHLIKLGLTSGMVSAIALNYERVLNDEVSTALTVSWLVPRKPSGLLDLQTDDIALSSSSELSGWFFTPEVKWYLEQNDVRPAPRGFYVCGYARYSNVRLAADMDAVSDSGAVEGALQVDFMELGIGAGAGYQLLFAKDRVAIDFIFFGPRYSIYTLKVDAELNGDQALIDDLSQALEEAIGRDVVPIDIELDKSGTTTNNRSGLGYRFGFKIGYAF